MQPKTPLELALPAVDDLLLTEAELFEQGGLTVKGFRAFMLKYSNWKAKDVDNLTVGERRSVADRIIAKLNEQALPKETSASS
jgi:hypothetical protein